MSYRQLLTHHKTLDGLHPGVDDVNLYCYYSPAYLYTLYLV